jgi:hypothetical protein
MKPLNELDLRDKLLHEIVDKLVTLDVGTLHSLYHQLLEEGSYESEFVS